MPSTNLSFRQPTNRAASELNTWRRRLPQVLVSKYLPTKQKQAQLFDNLGMFDGAVPDGGVFDVSDFLQEDPTPYIEEDPGGWAEAGFSTQDLAWQMADPNTTYDFAIPSTESTDHHRPSQSQDAPGRELRSASRLPGRRRGNGRHSSAENEQSEEG